MKNKKVKKLVLVIPIILTSFLIMFSCKSEDSSYLNDYIINQKKLDVVVQSWEHWKEENNHTAELIEKSRKEWSSRSAESSQYGFTIDEGQVQIIEHEDYTTHTFLALRDETQEGILENYMFKEFNNGSYKQYLLTYYYTSDSSGNIVFSTTDMNVEVINDDGLIIDRNTTSSGDCHPHFVEVYLGFICTTSQTCSGPGADGTHEVGDQCQCQITVMTCQRAGVETCEHTYGYTFDDCSGGGTTGDIDNPNNPENPPIGGGGGSGSSEDNSDTGTTDSVPFIYDLRLAEFENSLTPEQLEWWNNSYNRFDRGLIQDYLELNNYSTESLTFSVESIDFLRLNPNYNFNEYLNWFSTNYPQLHTNIEIIDPSDITYETSLTQQALPSFNDFLTNFPKNGTSGNYTEMPTSDVYELVGGSLLTSHQNNPDGYSNACSIRGSRGLLYSGIDIPVLKYNNSQRTQKGGDNNNYILDAVSFNQYMIDKFGDTSSKLEGADANDPTKVAELLKNKNGIYVIINNSYSQAGYSGHVDTIINGLCIGGAYTGVTGGVKSIRIWELN